MLFFFTVKAKNGGTLEPEHPFNLCPPRSSGPTAPRDVARPWRDRKEGQVDSGNGWYISLGCTVNQKHIFDVIYSPNIRNFGFSQLSELKINNSQGQIVLPW